MFYVAYNFLSFIVNTKINIINKISQNNNTNIQSANASITTAQLNSAIIIIMLCCHYNNIAINNFPN